MHADKFFRWSAEKPEPSDARKERVLYEMERAYGQYVRWRLPDDWNRRSAFDRAVGRIDMTSSPGLPYLREAPTNGEWLEWDGFVSSEFKLDRLWSDVCRVMSNDWEHLIRVFVKQEPHKKSKVDERRWRLIMASSLPVQVLWHMLFSYMNDREIEQSYYIPSQQGIVLVEGGWKLYRSQWDTLGLTQGLDKSAFDWTCPWWALRLDLDFRRRMGSGSGMAEWTDLAGVLYHHMFESPILVVSDGTAWQQVVPGVMKSGCVNTISTNSHVQVMVHLLVSEDIGVSPYPLCRACGDDTLQHPKHCCDVEYYRNYGIMVKSASDSIEFVGHEFTKTGPHPLYMAKHMKKLRYVKDEHVGQYLDSMARMYVHTRYFDVWRYLADCCGVSLPLSREAYLYWYDVAE